MTTTISVSAADVSLYHVAAAQLGDAQQWWRIAQANGMSDPDLSWLSGPVSVVIPVQNAALTGGVPGVSG